MPSQSACLHAAKGMRACSCWRPRGIALTTELWAACLRLSALHEGIIESCWGALCSCQAGACHRLQVSLQASTLSTLQESLFSACSIVSVDLRASKQMTCAHACTHPCIAALFLMWCQAGDMVVDGVFLAAMEVGWCFPGCNGGGMKSGLSTHCTSSNVTSKSA